MSDALAAELLKLGLPGIVILALGYWVYRQDTENRKIQAERLTDMKAAQSKLIEIIQASVTASADSTLAMEATREAIKEMRDAFDDWIRKRAR